MRVQKRNSRGMETLKFDKITDRIRHLCVGLDPIVDPTRIALATIKNIYDGITTEDLDKISAKIAESYKLIHPEYSVLAAKILISNLHKTTPKTFSQCMDTIGKQLDIKSERHYEFIARNSAAIDNMVIDSNDYNFDYFGYKTLENAYLVKIEEDMLGPDGLSLYVDRDGVDVSPGDIKYTRRGTPVLRNDNGVIVSALRKKTHDRVVDRPQYVFMRVAIAIYMNDENVSESLENIKQCYKALSQMYFTHATPTLFNACSKVQQLNSCFLLGSGDSIEEIMRNLSNASFISKWAGGIGIHMHKIRCRDSRIKGTNGKSSGLPKQLKMYNEAARCWDQGGKRLGAFAIYIEPHHGDIFKILQLKMQIGKDEERARDLFYALWVSDLFVKRVSADADWSLFSEATAPGLSDVYDGMDVCTKCGFCQNVNYAQLIHMHERKDLQGVLDGIIPKATDPNCTHTFEPKDVYTELYTRYEEEGLAVKVVKARQILDAIMDVQRESGTPYICFKDHVNRQTNQSNIGTIMSSNLCAEIMEWSSADSYACCTLASINLKKFLKADDTGKLRIDHEKLHEIVRMIARNLDIIIDVNRYPVDECKKNSSDYRPIGIGIQALADVFALKRIPFLSEEAARDDIEITETIYHAALTESMERAKTHGAYSAFKGSPASRGILRFDLWLKNQSRIGGFKEVPMSGRYDWDALKQDIINNGLRNSLHVAFMPTVSTSQILGNNESFEPYNSNIYTKTTLAGKFTVSNNAMIRHLIELGLWNEDLKNKVVNNGGSLIGINEIPVNVQEIYRTVWELKQAELMKRAAIRSAFIDQSQSLNIHVSDNSNSTLRSIFLLGWKLGLMTGNYYIRTQPASAAMKNNIAQSSEPKAPVVGGLVINDPSLANMLNMRPDMLQKINDRLNEKAVNTAVDTAKGGSKFTRVIDASVQDVKFTAEDDPVDLTDEVGCTSCSS